MDSNTSRRELSAELVEGYLSHLDWRVNENSNAPESIGALSKYTSGEIAKSYWLNHVYTPDIVKAYLDGYFHIHDLSTLSLYCCGYSLKDILKKGVVGVPNIPVSSPAKHLDSALSHITNLTSIFQNEIAGAVAFSSLDTLMAPFIKVDNLNYEEVYQKVQNFIYAINSNSRAGAEPAFSNVTLDIKIPKDMYNEEVIIAGVPQGFTYGDCQSEADLFNEVLLDIYLQGDSSGKPFSYPIPTYSIVKDFDWNSKVANKLFDLAGKFGTPYFSNYINSDMSPEDCRSMCCRLHLDLRELTRKNGGLFGSGDSTGSIGVVTINLPLLAYEAANDPNAEFEDVKSIFFSNLKYYMDLARKSLQMKRKFLEEVILPAKLLPAFSEYVGHMNNHFSTIGIVGMNEMCENLLGVGITDPTGKEFALEVGNYIRNVLSDYQETDGDVLWNYEATPAESTCASGDTLIQTLEGNIPIKELVGRDDVLVYCYDEKESKLHLRKAYDIRQTGVKQICRITFNDHTTVEFTPDHKFLVRYLRMKGRGKNRKTWYEYEWVAVKDLKTGDHIVSNYQYKDGVNGYGEDRLRFSAAGGQLAHRFIYEELTGTKIPDGYVVHHKDLNKDNNDLTNLELMTSSDHKSYHAKFNNPRPSWIGKDNPFYSKHHTEDSIKKMVESRGSKYITISDILPLIDLPYEDIARKLGCSRDVVRRRMKDSGVWDKHIPNHTVESVELLPGTVPVYNMEVEEFHNYFAGGTSGVLAHNCYRLAICARKKHPDIICQGPDSAPYFTNSCHAPVKTKWTIKELFDHQDELQTQFTGGTVVHIYCGGPMLGNQAKQMIKTICNNYSLPYISISPLITLCPDHGQLTTAVDTCPICGKETRKMQRITGYVRDTRFWNPGKKSEFSDRNQFQDFMI